MLHPRLRRRLLLQQGTVFGEHQLQRRLLVDLLILPIERAFLIQIGHQRRSAHPAARPKGLSIVLSALGTNHVAAANRIGELIKCHDLRTSEMRAGICSERLSANIRF